MTLSATAVRNAKPRDKAFKLSDGGGLFLFVAPNGGRYWRMGYRYEGKQKVLSVMRYGRSGKHRLEFTSDGASSFAFHGRYIEVIDNSRIVWTNEESDDGAVTTVTFEQLPGKTLLTFRDLYPSNEALEAEMGAEEAMPEQFEQLETLLAEIGMSTRNK